MALQLAGLTIPLTIPKLMVVSRYKVEKKPLREFIFISAGVGMMNQLQFPVMCLDLEAHPLSTHMKKTSILRGKTHQYT